MQVYRDTSVFDACQKAGVIFELYEPDPHWLEYLSTLFKELPKERIEAVKGDSDLSRLSF